MEYDVFISHAWEDKNIFVRPLADLLQKFGLSVWYDEFSLKVGDSLSRSIDKGLSNSHYGIVVLSKAFIIKPWTEYELRGLITKEVGKGKVILPIWYEITKDEIAQFSPTLADKVALLTEKLNTTQIALALLEQIRPDIHQTLLRRINLENLLDNGKAIKIKAGDLRPAEIRHKELSENLLVRLRIVYQTFGELLDQSIDDFIGNFQRDLRPDRELAQWEIMASVFNDVTNGKDFSKSKKRDILAVLLAISMGTLDKKMAKGYKNLTYQEVMEVLEARARAIPKIQS